MSNIILDNFIKYCDEMKVNNETIAIEENVVLYKPLRDDIHQRELYMKAIKNLKHNMLMNEDDCLNHAVNKHSCPTNAKKIIKKYLKKNHLGKVVSYMLRSKDFMNFISKAIDESNNDIMNQILENKEYIVITYNYDNSIGRMEVVGENESIDVTALLIVIGYNGDDSEDVPILKFVTAYPIHAKNRKFRYKSIL